MTVNREFVVPGRFAVFVGSLEGYGTIGRSADNFYQFNQRAVGSSSCMITFSISIISRHFFICFSWLCQSMVFFERGSLWKTAPNDCDGGRPPVGSPCEELNIFIGCQSEGLIDNCSRY